MGYFPLFFDLTDKKVLVVGAGRVASRRAAVLAEFEADVLVVAPVGTERMAELERMNLVRWERREFARMDLDGSDIVLAATDDAGLNDRIAGWCRELGILVCHAGDQSQSDFYFPGIAKKGDVVVGVTASGTDHRLAAQVTRQVQELIEDDRIG